ncbi:MAG: HAD family phosphatase [Leptolyngbyaceae cyanobacterium RM2_2_4]|nr:HAD family phosphatase [Leptolyngbyaceae cyanobacterium RM2_2_4]
MSFIPLSQSSSQNVLKRVRLIATDMDGTLTYQGKFTPKLLQALQELAIANIPVLIVTGRSAGWVNGLVSYLPVVGAIAENGGLAYFQPDISEMIVPISNLAEHRHRLAQTFADLKTHFPHLQESSDNRFRLTDWTFDIQKLAETDLQHLSDRCQSQGWSFTYSTVQCHIKMPNQDKAIALTHVLQHHFPNLQPDQVLTVGDSPNDESLFDGDRFPLSVGVANVLHYGDRLTHQPTYVTHAAEVEGFCEVAKMVIEANSH